MNLLEWRPTGSARLLGLLPCLAHLILIWPLWHRTAPVTGASSLRGLGIFFIPTNSSGFGADIVRPPLAAQDAPKASLKQTESDHAGGSAQPKGDAPVTPGAPERLATTEEIFYPAAYLDRTAQILQEPDFGLAPAIQGLVKLVLYIDSAGRLVETRILHSDPDPELGQLIADGFYTAEFEPAQREGRQVASIKIIEMRILPQTFVPTEAVRVLQ